MYPLPASPQGYKGSGRTVPPQFPGNGPVLLLSPLSPFRGLRGSYADIGITAIMPSFRLCRIIVGKDGKRHDLDIVIGAPYFQVLPISQGDEPIANWISSWGNIVLNDNHLTINEER